MREVSPAAKKDIELNKDQLAIVHAPIPGSIHLFGESGTGKTTAAANRLRYLIDQGIPGESILVLVPQRSLARDYYSQIQDPNLPSGGIPAIQTFGGLAQRLISLFWPLIAREAGFKHPEDLPVFLNLETAQYYLATLVDPLLQQGYFESITIDPNRLYSQILDNLNKSAVVGFPPEQISARLTQAWSGKSSQAIIYKQAEECALKFRQYCFANNLLDFSLQLSLFSSHLFPSMIVREYLHRTYQHLIYDNVEEDIPVAHDFIGEWIPSMQTALLIRDMDGGFRSFLGADPYSGARLADQCQGKFQFSHTMNKSDELQQLENSIKHNLLKRNASIPLGRNTQKCFSTHSFRFYPEVMDWICEEVASLITKKGVQPHEIAILTPFLSDSLRFSFSSRLQNHDVSFTTYRPSRTLRDEPAVKTILAIVKLANPGWGLHPEKHEVRTALMHAIAGCDLIRADMLTQMLLASPKTGEGLRSFDRVRPEMQSRISYIIGERFERLRTWIITNQDSGLQNLDHFMSRLFGEILSQPGFGFHNDFESASVSSHLVESCQRFKMAFHRGGAGRSSSFGPEYIRVLEHGILAAQSLGVFSDQQQANAVFLSPAFSFLMSNRPVRYQFWVDIGSQGWWNRLDQPLTQPYVLNRNWQQGKPWTDADEYENNQMVLSRVITGLIRRCKEYIFMCTINFNEQGIEERGPLVMAVQSILRELNLANEVGHV